MRPKTGDYPPYCDSYISLLEGDDIIRILEDQMVSSGTFLRTFSEEKANFAYETGKWTVKEVVGHVLDTERIMAYRALSFARGEKQPLPGFEQDDYVAEGNFSLRTLSELISEFNLARESNMILFKSFTNDMLKRSGIANGYKMTVLALLYIIAGHEKHHIKILKERYLK